jgi:hypothetical protein
MPHTCNRCMRPIKGDHTDSATFVFEATTAYRDCVYCKRNRMLREETTRVDGVDCLKLSYRYLESRSRKELKMLAKHIGYRPPELPEGAKPDKELLIEAILQGTHDEHRPTKEIIGYDHEYVTICHNCNTTPLTRL